jgi:EAL domain-containing protein (putative c-di-GMP-specific phosphodiesterase class I)
LEPQYLELELTESILTLNTEIVVNTIKTLKALGVSFAIDDFGTGFSSLNHLRQFAVNRLKIDQSFVRELCSGHEEDGTIVQAIIRLSETLGLHTLAEGVETVEQAAYLRQLGCEVAQGFYWHEAMPASDFTVLLTPLTESGQQEI